jgi:hypothetical protein
MTVLGPATESPTYLLLSPSLAAALLASWRRGRPRWTFWVYIAATGLLLAASASCWFAWSREFGQLGPQPFAGLLTLAGLVTETLQELCRRRWRQARQETNGAGRARPGPSSPFYPISHSCDAVESS